jgi:hypothetical protein
LSSTKRYTPASVAITEIEPPNSGLAALSSDVTRRRLIGVIYYSDGAFQGYGFEN